MHEKYSGTKERLIVVPDFKCSRCLGLALPMNGRPVDHVFLGNQKLDVVESFMYLENGLSPSGGCEARTIASACCIIFLSPFLNVTRMSMSTVSFLAQLDYGIVCL